MCDGTYYYIEVLDLALCSLEQGYQMKAQWIHQSSTKEGTAVDPEVVLHANTELL